MKNQVNRCFGVAVLAGVLAVAMSVRADTLLWYRFNESDGATVVNKANPGTMDGTLKSINTWGSLGGLGNTTAKFPKRGDAFPEGTRIIDPATDAVVSGAVKSLSFSGDANNSGIVLLSKADASSLVALKRFTCEAFFRIPSAALDRSADALFPIVEFGTDKNTDDNQGWKLGFFLQSGKFQPWVRGCLANSSNGKGSAYWTINSGAQVISKGNGTLDSWHHIALVVDGDGNGGSATVSLIVDYKVAATKPIEEYYGFYFHSGSSFPLTIGADLYRTTAACSFMGDIAEFRISNTALATDELLRPLPAGPVDADTLVYLPMGDCDWFGSTNTASYKNIYHGVLNAAPTAAYTPYWTNGTTSAAYPASAEDVAGASIRDGYFATDSFVEAKSTTFSRALVSGQYAGHVLRVPYTNAHLAEGSFTMEWFFKTDGQVPSGNAINSYTFLNNTFAKIMINQASGLLLTRLVKAAGGYADFYSSVRVDDGKWHHYALVYDKSQSAFAAYLDYRKINSMTYELTTSTSSEFYFGGQNPTTQAFAGQLDDFRITKRALKANEFLTTRSLVSRDALFAHFEGDLSTGQDAALAPAGVGGTLGGGAAPTFVSINRRIDFDGDGKADCTSTKALRLDGGSVVYPHNSLLECRDFTAEWFAKYDSLAPLSMILRFGMSSEDGTGTICWALYSTQTASDVLNMSAHVSSNGAWTGIERVNRQFKDLGTIADGKWHHWALVAQTNPDVSPANTTNTTFKLYRDYKKIGEQVFHKENGEDGILALPSTGTTLSIGTSASSLNGTIDELRVTPSVLVPENFMHRLPSGLTLILR